MVATGSAGTRGVVGWSARGGVVAERPIGRHRSGLRALLSWHRMFYVAKHRRY